MMKSAMILGLLTYLSSIQAQPRPLGMSPNPEPYEVEQPDGSTILVRMAGTEDDPLEECAPGEGCEGFTIIGGGPAGNEYQFAVVDDETGDIKPNGQTVKRGKNAPQGVAKHVRRGEAASAAKAMGGRPMPTFNEDGKPSGTSGKHIAEYIPNRRLDHIDQYDDFTPETENFHRRTMSWTGVKRTLVIPLVFSDHKRKWRPPHSGINKLFNRIGGDGTYAPTGSIRDVFRHASYNKLDMVSEVQDFVFLSKPESYYADGDRGFTYKMHEAMEEALEYLENVKKLDFSQFDADNDGLIDSICFLHSGYAAEWGGNSKDGANYLNRIWSHKWGLYGVRDFNGRTGWKSKTHNVRVLNYHISPFVWGTGHQGNAIGRIGVIAHETGHFLGITDLYDTAGEAGNGIGSWGLMANSWGFDNTQKCPPAMSPWTKMQLGWLRPRTISRSGTYTARPSYRYGNAHKISKGFPSNEYLLIEYRMPLGFEKCMPTRGIAVWHIDDSAEYSTQGYPGQNGWPGNGNHYRVALLQADGQYDLEKNKNRGDAGDLFKTGQSIGPGYNPQTRRTSYPNTDSYKNGNVKETGIKIDVGVTAHIARFTVTFGASGSPQQVAMAGSGPDDESSDEEYSTGDSFDVEVDYKDEMGSYDFEEEYGYGEENFEDEGDIEDGYEEEGHDEYEIVDEYGETFKDEKIKDVSSTFQNSLGPQDLAGEDEYLYGDEEEGESTFDGKVVDGRVPEGEGENFVDTEMMQGAGGSASTEEAFDEYALEEEVGGESLGSNGRAKASKEGMGFN